MKKTILVVLLVVLIIIIIFGFFGCNYNRLVRLEETVKQAWAQVENQYQRRMDLIPNLIKTVQGAADFERTVLTEVTDARSKAGQMQINANDLTDPDKFAKFQQAQDQLSSAISRLLVVVERYPEIKSNQNFLELQAQLEGTENRISVERKNFNEAVQAFNSKVRSFPTNIIAGMFGFKQMEYFKGREGSDRPPDVNFEFDKKQEKK
ncbi:MAG: LemA family protein [Ignavibacteria bacterium]|nr:LemA family protein [Ignavibacteria bacterium]